MIGESPSKFYEAVIHVLLIGGKKIRPILATLCCEALGGYPEDAKQWGLGVELVHNSSLIHDDIVDEDEKRRNIPTVHMKYGVPVAINVGDALLGEAFNVLSTLPESRMQHHGIDGVKELIVSIAIAAKDLGMMFQIKDDLLGLIGGEELLGKTVGIDIKEKKRTLYLIHALSNASEEDKEVLMKLLTENFRLEHVEIARDIYIRFWLS
jgi:geranylgeranyl diphosphate synthase type I